MIDVFDGFNGHQDEAEADAKAAEDVFKGLDMVRINDNFEWGRPKMFSKY